MSSVQQQKKVSEKRKEFLKLVLKQPNFEADTCCLCGHKLSSHIDEKDGWRCHSISPHDSYQCECYLRKNRYAEGLSGYDLNARIKQHNREFEEGTG